MQLASNKARALWISRIWFLRIDEVRERVRRFNA
jgi:hypothetical protein